MFLRVEKLNKVAGGNDIVSKTYVIGLIIELIGCALWIYGYFVAGHPAVIDWHAIAPNWIAEWLPNLRV